MRKFQWKILGLICYLPASIFLLSGCLSAKSQTGGKAATTIMTGGNIEQTLAQGENGHKNQRPVTKRNCA